MHVHVYEFVWNFFSASRVLGLTFCLPSQDLSGRDFPKDNTSLSSLLIAGDVEGQVLREWVLSLM